MIKPHRILAPTQGLNSRLRDSKPELVTNTTAQRQSRKQNISISVRGREFGCIRWRGPTLIYDVPQRSKVEARNRLGNKILEFTILIYYYSVSLRHSHKIESSLLAHSAVIKNLVLSSQCWTLYAFTAFGSIQWIGCVQKAIAFKLSESWKIQRQANNMTVQCSLFIQFPIQTDYGESTKIEIPQNPADNNVVFRV